MKPNLFDVISLNVDRPDLAMSKGAIGTIVLIFSEPDEAYEVEFCDDLGATLAQAALRPEEFSVVRPADRSPHD